MIDLGTLTVGLVFNVSDFGRSVGMAHRYMRNFEDLVEDVSRSVVGLASSTMTAGLEMVESFQKAELQLTALTGSGEEAVAMLEKMKDFAIETPFGFDEVARGVRILGAYGTEVEATLPLMELFGDTVTKTGNGTADELRRIVIAFSQIRAAGKLMTQDMNQMSNVAGNVWQAVADSMGMSVRELRNEVKTGFVSSDDALKAIIEHMLQYRGGMRDLTRTLAGAWQAAKEDMATALGEGLMPFAEALVPLVPQVLRLSKAFGKFMGPVVQFMITLADYALQVLIVFNSLAPETQNLVFALAALAAGLTLVFTTGMGALFIVSSLVSAIMGLGSVLLAMGAPAVIVLVAGIGTLIAAIAVLTMDVALLAMAWQNNWFRIRDIVLNVVKSIGAAFATVMEWSNKYGTSVALIWANVFTDVLNLMYSMAAELEAIPGAPQWITDTKNALADAHFALEDFKDGLADVGAHGAIATGASEVKNLITQAVSSFLTSTEESFTEFIDGPLAALFKSMLPDKIYGHVMGFMQATKKGSIDPDYLLKQILEMLGIGEGAAGGRKLTTGELNKFIEEYVEWTLANAFAPSVQKLWDVYHALQGLPEALQRFADDLDDAFQPMIKYIEDVISRQAAAAEALPNANIGMLAGDEGGSISGMLGGQITGALPETVSSLLKLGSAAAMLSSSIISVLIGTETIQYLFSTLDGLFSTFSTVLDKFISPFKSLFNVLGQILSAVLELVMVANPFSWALLMVATLFRDLAVLLVPIMSALQTLGTTFSLMGSELVEIISGSLQPVLEILFWVFKGLAEIVLAFGIAAGALWNAFVWAVTGVIDVIQAIPGFGKTFKDLEKQLEDSQCDLDGMADDMQDLVRHLAGAGCGRSLHREEDLPAVCVPGTGRTMATRPNAGVRVRCSNSRRRPKAGRSCLDRH